MNKFLKVFIAILGAFDEVFRIFLPIIIAIVLITYLTSLSQFSMSIIIITCVFSTLYRAIKMFIPILE